MQTKFKRDIAKEYAAIEDIPVNEAEKRINAIFEIVTVNLVEGNDVKLANFFNFFVKDLKAKDGVHPQTGKPMVINAVRTVVSKMTKPLKERIQGKR
ncbi:HU family DNA-binding protein [Solibacillus silvestris]